MNLPNKRTVNVKPQIQFKKEVTVAAKQQLILKPELAQPSNNKSSKKLLVGSVFVNLIDENNLKWLDLQLKYFEETTDSFDHITFVHDLPPELPKQFKGRTQILFNKTDRRVGFSSPGHVKGLDNLLAYFKSCRQNYGNFLFIDMDAFPIKKNWMNILINKMEKKYEIATVLRCENLETRLHSSVLFATDKSLDHLQWGVEGVGEDLVGNPERDVKIREYQDKRRDKAFVMLRSNKHEVHPLLCGVYYDMFYHHACGTGRKYNMRAAYYWDRVFEIDKTDPGKWNQELFDNPNEFISNLAGWNKDLYANIKKEYTSV